MLPHAAPSRVSTALCLSHALARGSPFCFPVIKRKGLLCIHNPGRKFSSKAFLKNRLHVLGDESEMKKMVARRRKGVCVEVLIIKWVAHASYKAVFWTQSLVSELLQSICYLKNDKPFLQLSVLPCGLIPWLGLAQEAQASEQLRVDMVYEVGELFELGIQLTYLLILLGLLGFGSFFVIRQVLVRRELDLSAKELQEQVRSGDATATGYFELGAVMLRRKFYSAAIKYLQQAIERWDGDDQDLAQVYNALGVSYVRDNKLDKGILQFENAVKLQPGYVTAWNNLGDAYEKKKDLKAALKAFEEALLFDPNNKIARPRRDVLRDRVELYKGVPIKSEERR